MLFRLSAVSLVVVSAFVCSSCAVTAVVVDRQTVMEVQSGGEWPELDREFREASLDAGPKPLRKTSALRDNSGALRMIPADGDASATKR